MNLINSAITKIHFVQPKNTNCTIEDDVSIDTNFPFELLRSKIIVTYLTEGTSSRLTFKQALDYANHHVKTGLCILTNLDIFFDYTLISLANQPQISENTVFYLSRYEIDPYITKYGSQCSEKTYFGSHDALIFSPPLPEYVIDQYPFELGTWHVETKIIYELLRQNYRVRNICKSIRAWHLHSSQVRHRLMPSKKYVDDRLLYKLLRKPEYLDNAALETCYSRINIAGLHSVSIFILILSKADIFLISDI